MANIRKFKTAVEMETALTLSSLTASRALQLDGSGNVEQSAVTSTELGYLSGVTSAVQTQLDDKMALITTPTEQRALVSDSLGQPIESAITISGNDVTIPGNLTVSGTTTTIDTATLNVTDANITVNDGGTQASANSADAGITVEMSDATDVFIGYDSTLASRFAIGDVGAGKEVADVSSAQTLTNKTIDGTAAGTNTVTTDADQVSYERLDASKKNIQGTSDEAEAALTDLDDAIGALVQGTNYTATSAAIVSDHLQALDTALGGTNSDENVKVSANDTTAKYLEDAIVVASGSNISAILEVSTLNDGADEDFQIRIDESKIVHDNLSGFVANEHVDHSAVDITAGSGLSGGGDITATRTIDLDVNSLVAAAVAAGDEFAFADADAAFAMKKITFANIEAALNHDSLSGYVANEHIDHTAVDLTAGDGLSGGGDISASRSFAVDITGSTDKVTPVAADEILLGDSAAAGAIKKADVASLAGAISHDALADYVANEHIDHSAVNITTAADSGLSGGGDITASRSLVVDIAGTTLATVPNGSDEILISVSGALKSMSRSDFLGAASSSAGDIGETSFSAANNVVAATNVTGFAFANATVRSFNALVSVEIDATADLFEEFTIQGIQKGAGWDISIDSVGDDSVIAFSITSAGQMQYTSGNEAGYVSSKIKFRAITTSIG